MQLYVHGSICRNGHLARSFAARSFIIAPAATSPGIELLHPDSARNRLVGIGFVSLTYVCFTLLDGNAKWLIRAVPVIEVVWIRFVSHALLSAGLLLPIHGRALLASKRLKLQVVRGMLMVSMTAINFTALQYLQLTVT